MITIIAIIISMFDIRNTAVMMILLTIILLRIHIIIVMSTVMIP